jgi:replicative DNA helicase
MEKKDETENEMTEKDEEIFFEGEPDEIEEAMDKALGPPVSMRIPPHNLDVEITILRIMLLNKMYIQRAKEVLSIEGDEFYREANRLIYLTILKLFKKGQPADLITLGAELKRNYQLERAGGENHLKHIFLEETPSIEKDGYSPDNFDAYLNLLKELGLLRQLIMGMGKVSEIAFQGNIQKLERPLKGLIKRIRRVQRFIAMSG